MNTKYHPIFQFPHIHLEHDENHQFLSYYLTQFEKDAKPNSIGKQVFSWLPEIFIFSLFNTPKDILFFAPSFLDLIKSQNAYSVKFLSGLSFRNLVNHSIFPVYLFSQKILDIYRNDPLLVRPETEKFIQSTVKWMDDCKFKYLIVQNDSLYIERFLLHCAKKTNILTICIQHGIFLQSSSKNLVEGKFSDYFFAWDEAHASLIQTSSAAKVKILGYPHNFNAINNQTACTKQKICILGQPYENLNLFLAAKKCELFSNLFQILAPLFDTIVYKPHPLEKDMTYIPKGIQLFTDSLAEAINEYDVFFSITSTALLEVTLANKIAIQIYDEDFDCDNMEEAGYAYSLNSKQLHTLPSYIASLESSFLPFCTVPVYPNIAQRFIDLLNEIETENKTNILEGKE